MQRPGDYADGLELCSGVADGLLVDGEGLREKLVRNLFESRLVSRLTAGNEKA
jgi:hypothetical protein